MLAEIDDTVKESSNFNKKNNGTFKNILTRRLKDVSGICGLILANGWKEEVLLNEHFSNKPKQMPHLF